MLIKWVLMVFLYYIICNRLKFIYMLKGEIILIEDGEFKGKVV